MTMNEEFLDRVLYSLTVLSWVVLGFLIGEVIIFIASRG